MNRLHVALVFCIVGIIGFFYGCAAIGGGDALDRYKEIEGVTFVFEERSSTTDNEPVLTEESTLSDYLAYAALHNPELEASFNRWEAALMKIPQVQSLPDPRFTYAYYIENVETRVGPQRHKFDLSQTFPWFGKLALLGDLALQEANIQKQAYETVKLSLFYKVKVSYYDYYYLSRAIAVTEDNMKLLSYLENVTRTKYSAGEATHVDVIKAQVELGKLEERLLSLRDLKEPVRANLNASLNRPTDAVLPWPTALQEKDIALSDEDIIRRINKDNPGLKALDFRALRETKAIDLAKKQFYPDITFGVNFIETDTALMPGTVDSGKDPVVTMFSINLPVWRGKYRAAVQEAKVRYDSAVKVRDNRVNELIAEVKTALYNFRDSGRKVELYRDSLIPKAKQSLNVTQRAFETGKKDFLNLIDAQRTLLELELAHERALTDRSKHFAYIERLVGSEL